MDNYNNILFDMPKNQSNAIKVIGVGGGGSNAVNYMLSQGIKGVDFVICNTDVQALQNSQVPLKIQLGVTLTEGLGAGANPEIGKQSALESEEEIKEMLSGKTKMVFINAGMGGGTGTGAAPVIAKFAKELDLLTIGVVTIPFSFEGKTRNEQAQKGIEELRSHVDSLVVINNNKLREVYGNLGFKAGFAKADEVLATASRGIAEVITHHYTQNIDLRDAKTVLANSGTAIMGSAKASGDNRAEKAIAKALESPLLNDNKIEGAKNVLLLIVSGSDEITIDEIGEINDYIQSEAKTNVNIIMGVGEDETLNEAISVTVVATGFHKDQQRQISNLEDKKIIHTLEGDQEVTYNFSKNNGIQSNTSTDMPIAASDIKKNSIQEKTIFSLLDEDEEVLVPTSEKIKNIEVVHEDVTIEKMDDFVITTAIKDIEVTNFEEIVAKKTDSIQTTFTFDLPITETKKETIDINNIEVVDHIVVKPSENITEQVYFNLEDYNELEERLHKAKKDESSNDKETELQFNVRTEPIDEPLIPSKKEEISPLNLTISELQSRSKDRKEKMKQFNYKFSNKLNKNIDEIEKEPAYKRKGIDIEETQLSSETNQSRTVLGIDENNEIQLRSNNSFLHDNVD